MKFPGGKNHGSSYPRIINQIPPHELFIEPFAGSAAIRRLMRPCRQSLLIVLDPGALGRLAEQVPAGTELLHGDGLEWLMEDRLCLDKNLPPTVVYCDPPYVASACASRLRYEHVLGDDQHARLLCRCKQLRCCVLISGYWSELYADHLAGWRVVSWPQITRGGTWSQEFLWCNFPEPVQLHDYRHLGLNFRERQDLKRQQQRWHRKLDGMTTLRRQALLSVLADLEPGRIGGTAVEIHRPGAIGRSAEPAGDRPAAKVPLIDRALRSTVGGSAEPADGDITAVVLPIAPGRTGHPRASRRERRGSTPPPAASAGIPSGDGQAGTLGRNAESGRPRSSSAEMPIAAALGKNADGGHQT